ncbi:hypothetical protein COCSADRAFT_101412 [Bipolaris sorokiniana ND90Pr]|uniref:Tat pathway signal sequence n=1 Tax=Cochliobolus sativus (strain ND90Pr / ATCC 201652) TaxID=665912 RepID=M2S9W7_COCSN|nr:uncharacterized protein COCSADRAFT_101412 [Bipolaris sorokiniana ND90Pr]EMD59335.1 hypothetical protein COCSADRAFT_101412 [Bipolaris sorokiniana ND90Pr]
MLKVFNRQPKHDCLHRRDSESQDSDGLLPVPSSGSPPLKPSALYRPSRDTRVAVRVHVLCTIVYVGATLWMAFHMNKTTSVVNADEFCIHHISQYSPVVRDVKPNWHMQLFNGSFLHQSVYRQSAGPEVDAAWDALGINYRSVVVPEAEAERTGLRHDQVKISQEYGGGFPANVEGLHHLHCLDLLRKTLYWNYDYYLAQKQGAFVNSEYIVRVHATHCLDTIRQVLMCNPDVGVLGQVWWQPDSEPEPMPFVDFNTKHRCRDYKAIRQWAEEHQLPPETEVDMERFYQRPKAGDTVLGEIP